MNYQDILNPALKTILGDHAEIDVKVDKAVAKMKQLNINPDEVFLGNDTDRSEPAI